MVPFQARTQPSASISVVSHGRSAYAIVVQDQAPASDRQAALLLQKYLGQVTGVVLPVTGETANGTRSAIFVGRTRALTRAAQKLPASDGILIRSDDRNLYLAGGDARGTRYSVCAFLERFCGCRLYSPGELSFRRLQDLDIPAGLRVMEEPAFRYREIYYPFEAADDYLDWHGLQRLDDLWGLWGHSSFKIIPPATYFAAHPEYFALVNGVRTPTQLCPSSREVLRLTVAYLKRAIAAAPDAEYWSISPQDGGGFCSCDLCRQADREDGSPSGAWLQFVNRVAGYFPRQKFVLLAYGPTARPTLRTRPAPNVYIMVSSIDIQRQQPMEISSSAASFRRDLTGWLALTPHVFVWDYTTQFTNYLAPFPDYDMLAPNLRYLKRVGVEGVFEQGSGDTYSDMAEYKSYLLSSLLWNPDTPVSRLREEFMTGYYGRAGVYVTRYLDSLTAAVGSTRAVLDIYGNPVHDARDYLSPGRIDVYSSLLDSAAAAAEASPAQTARVARLRLPVEYTVLQQSLFFGTQKHGYLVRDDEGGYKPDARWPARVHRFVAACQKAGVKELSEGGLSPEAYGRQWDSVLATPWQANLAFGAKVTLQYPYSEDYPARGPQTLTDGLTGGRDFSLNWLFIYGNDLVATIDLGKTTRFSRVRMHFLQDERHYIYLPESITVEVSTDGVRYERVAGEDPRVAASPTEPEIRDFSFSFASREARYLRVTATCPRATPRPGKKASLCSDEVYVLP
jgi:hypothetical protein